MHNKMSRRRVLLGALQIPLGGSLFAGLAACEGAKESAVVCADPGTMTSAEESVRRTLRYTEVSADAAKTCSGCEFFSAAAGACGSCGIFDGKPVNSGGHCDSWSADS